VDTYSEREFDGVVYRTGPNISRMTRTAEVEIRIPNPDHLLKPGMFVRLCLDLERKENVTVVPDAAMLRQGSEVFVYVVNGSKAYRRVLKLGISEGDRYEVVEGLELGDLVVVKGQHMLEDESEVTIAEEDRP